MKIKNRKIDCSNKFSNSKRLIKFEIVEFSFYYNTNNEDKELIDRIVKKGKELGKQVFGGAANNSKNLRPLNRRISNSIAGLLAEYGWFYYLNDFGKIKNVEFTEFVSANNQIDLRTVHKNKLIEVRSSFPRNGVVFALCHPKYEFDVIGPYSNTYKPGEIDKDFYLRALFHVEGYKSFMKDLFVDDFKMYLTGGANWEMMNNPQFYVNKNFIPEDGFFNEETNYRVIPFSKSLDAVEIKKLILRE